jgi:hypothetical protein
MIKKYVGLHVKYPLFLFDYMKLEFFCHLLEKSSNIKFHENPSSGSRVVPCGWMDGEMDRYEAKSHFLQFCDHA